jgi:hypothetical protein
VVNDAGGSVAFPVNNPDANRHVVVQATSVVDAYGPGCGLEIVKLRFDAGASPPPTCFLAWDFSNAPNPPSQLITELPAQVRPTAITFCDLFQLCTVREVTGTVSYFQGYPNGNDVNDATVEDINTNPTDVSNPGYTLVYPLGGGDVTLTASRTTVPDDQDAITGFDLIQTLRHVAFTIVLSEDQAGAADVNRNDGVDGSDAQFLAQWLAMNPGTCNPANPGATNCTSTWRFQFDPEDLAVKDEITFPLGCVVKTVNLKAFFLGDVDGTWPNNFKPAGPSRVDLQLQLVDRTAESVTVGLNADLAQEAFESIIFSLTYDGAALRYAGIEIGRQASEELFVTDNNAEPGAAHGVAVSWRTPSSVSGELLRFRFDVLQPGARAPISFARLKVNDRAVEQVPVLDIGTGESGTTPTLALPRQYSLRVAPNPFNPMTRIAYTIPENAGSVPVQIRVYDIAGRLVRTLVSTHQGPGYHDAAWNGRDAAGNESRSGIYMVRVQAGNWTDVQKVSLLK